MESFGPPQRSLTIDLLPLSSGRHVPPSFALQTRMEVSVQLQMLANTDPSSHLTFNKPLGACCAVVRCSVMAKSATPWITRSLPGPSAHGILQTRILEWVAMPSSRGSSQPRDWIQVSSIAGRFFTIWATRETPREPSAPYLSSFDN